jgi:cytochrome c553
LYKKLLRNIATASFWLLFCTGLLTGCRDAESSTASVSAAPAQADTASTIERGRYMVENVGMCADCHSPMTPNGPDTTKHLMGSKLGFTPNGPVPGWVDNAPRIAGLPNGWTKDAMANFLQTGKKPGGISAGPPMPAIRLSEEDAHAVAEYLASLPKQ